MKTCKQCRRELADEHFRKVESRSKGVRKSKPGRRPICKYCENMNVQAHCIVKALDAGKPVDEAKISRVKSYYQVLVDAGYPILTAAAQRLMGVASKPTVDEAAQSNTNDKHLYEHIEKLRKRLYASFDEAESIHNSLLTQLSAAGLYADANDLIDEWFEEG